MPPHDLLYITVLRALTLMRPSYIGAIGGLSSAFGFSGENFFHVTKWMSWRYKLLAGVQLNISTL
jgi:L-fucose isomerase-like protein